MRMLKEVIGAVSDFKNFRVPDASKAAHYSCEWGAKEDGMLLVGINKHGYGAWVDIRDDPELGLGDKLFLEEHRVDKKEERIKGEDKAAKAPGAVHLVRRADYLLSVLKAKFSDDQAAKRAVENHHRNNKKHNQANGVRRSENRASVSASPVPQFKKLHRQSDSHHSRERGHNHGEHRNSDSHRGSDVHRQSHGENGRHKPDLKRKHSGADDDRHHDRHKQRKADSGPSNLNHEQDMLRIIFKPIRESLKRVQGATKEHIKSQKERAIVLKKELIIIGNFIDGLEADEEMTALRPKFW
jgi:chromodomain-helicase-DNA-binding protein 1